MQLIHNFDAATALILLLTTFACTSRATTSATYREHRDPTAQVSSPQVVVDAAGQDFNMAGRWGADVVSAATPVMAAPDAFTRATEFKETRHEAGIDVDWQTNTEQILSGSYLASSESDYFSHTGTAGLSQEILDRHATLSGAVRLGLDRIGRADLPEFSETMWSAGGSIEFTRVITADFIGHIIYDLEGRMGYQANPYRLVPVFEGASSTPTVVVSERHPRRRLRHAIEPLAVWSPTKNLFFHGSYRFYVDDWGIRSHTLRAEFWRLWREDLLRGRLHLRAYTQEEADFYQARYDREATYRSGDYRLSQMQSLTGGARLDLRPPSFGRSRRLYLSLNYDITMYRFANYAPRSSMIAHSGGLTFNLEWQ